MVQVYNVSTEAVHSVDITQQNTVSKERAACPQNSEVEKIAISADGQNMATVDCLWSDLSRILLKFWSWSEDIVNYTLNTQVEFPHQSGVQSICFQPNTGHRSQVRPMLLTVGCDDKAKVWRLGSNNWSCESCISYKQLKTRAGDWSSDGSMIGLGCGHVLTLWSSADTRMKASLSLENREEITNVVFGRGPFSRHVYTTTSQSFISWDLVTMSAVWSLSLQFSPHTSIVLSPSSPLMSIIQKNSISIINQDTKTVETLSNMNCTGGGAWQGEDLFYLDYDGSLSRLSRRHQTTVNNTSVITSSTTTSSWLLNTRLNKQSEKVAPMTRARTMHDIDSLLALPLHTLPPPSQLSQSFIR